MDRKILHVDMNNFYASVELLARPDLADKPVIVGGDETKRHGVVLAKNELAKRCGVVTAETIYQARRKCPGAVILPPHHDWYRDYSHRARAIYRRYTERMQPFGPDEAWLDVTHLPQSGYETAREIQQVVLDELKLHVSVGVSWNKTFAKMGSDYKKPAAITVISRENYKEILWPLDVRKFLFVGDATAEKLFSLGIQTIGELAAQDPEHMALFLGKHGRNLVLNARGLDDSPVLTEEEQGPRKSIGAMETTARDLSRPEEAEAVLRRLAGEVAERAAKQGMRGQTVRLTVKNQDFVSRSRQRKLPLAVETAEDIFAAARALYREHFGEEKAIRLLGITLDNLEESSAARQMTLFDLAEEKEKAEEAEAAAGASEEKTEEAEKAEKTEEAEEAKKQQKLQALLAELQERFGEEHIHRGIKKEEDK